MVKIIQASQPLAATLTQLFTAYLQELNEDICFQNYESEFANPLGFYENHGGAVFVALLNEQVIGCVAYKNIGGGKAEMKRLYVPAEYRKLGAGKLLVLSVEQAAKQQGYTTMVLDTLERLAAAVQLYQQTGYQLTKAYYHNPLPGVLYFEKEL